jgi:hypothetical protein
VAGGAECDRAHKVPTVLIVWFAWKHECLVSNSLTGQQGTFYLVLFLFPLEKKSLHCLDAKKLFVYFFKRQEKTK